eukprot:SAG11_NODE_14039_length_627_cov_3.155303_1_plen_158_part_00
MKMKMTAGEETLKASDGLAPAWCGGLMMSLFTPRLAAPGAGTQTNMTAVAEQKSATAGEALRGAQGRASASYPNQQEFRAYGSDFCRIFAGLTGSAMPSLMGYGRQMTLRGPKWGRETHLVRLEDERKKFRYSARNRRIPADLTILRYFCSKTVWHM